MKTLLNILKHDRLLHFFFGFVIFILANIFLSELYSFLVVVFIAFGKEIYDKYIKKTFFDIYDLIFTTLAGLMLIINNLL